MSSFPERKATENFLFSVAENDCYKQQNDVVFFVETYENAGAKKFTVHSNLTFELNYIILFIGIYINACQYSGGYRKRKDMIFHEKVH